MGEIFGNYQVVAALGKGGMGVVYLAEHQRISRRAAIKVLTPELTTNPDVVKRFFIEARATSLIRHPGIVEVFDCDVDAAGRAYIVMEYLQGETLASCLRRGGALPWRMACFIGKRIACAVGAAHDGGIIHRDLKPDNVFLLTAEAAAASPDSEVKILDFGIAKLLCQEGSNESITRTGMVLGTPLYIAPEQCGSTTEVDHRTDVYALGCILFEMVCGRPPFQREGYRALLMAHMFESPPLASTLVPDLPRWLEQLISRMLAKRPADRPASMADVAEVLERASGVGEAPVGDTLILPAPVGVSKWAVALRRPGMWLAGVVGGLAALAAIGVIVLSRAPGHALTAAADMDDSAATTHPAATPGVAARHEMAARQEAADRNAKPDVNLASTIEATTRRSAGTLSALAPGSEPDASSASMTAPPTSHATPTRRAVVSPPRLHAESPHLPARVEPARVETDGIVDL